MANEEEDFEAQFAALEDDKPLTDAEADTALAIIEAMTEAEIDAELAEDGEVAADDAIAEAELDTAVADAEADAVVADAIAEAEEEEEEEEEEAVGAPVEMHVRRTDVHQTDKALLGLFSADGRFSRFWRNTITGHPKGSIAHRWGLKSGGRRTRRRKSRKRRKRKRTRRKKQRTKRRRTKHHRTRRRRTKHHRTRRRRRRRRTRRHR